MDGDQIVDQILSEAMNRRATDIHFEPHGDGCRVFLRVDGLLHEHEILPLEAMAKANTRIKVLANLPVYERDVPMDGHFEVPNGELPLQARVSVMPTIHGEKSVIRIFHRNECDLDLRGLGFGDEVLRDLMHVIEQRQGVLLFTGPSGSGKTTSIYALLEWIHKETRGETNIVTLEDPVERDLGFAAQTPLSKCKGLSYSQALAHLLRQDPEVIVVGEIRDPETAQIAVRAGLTGHQVISTIHSRDTAEVFLRLLEMGVEGYLVASAVVGVVAQRLVRTLCPNCKSPIDLPAPLQERLGLESGTPTFEPNGCEACASVGYLGRTAVAESVRMNEELRESILSRSRLSEVRRVCEQSMSETLESSAIGKLRQGLTCAAEILRVLPGIEKGKRHAAA